MTRPRCLVVGTGRMAGGFVAPVLHAAGWAITLAGRDEVIVRDIAERGAIDVRIGAGEARVDGIEAVQLAGVELEVRALEADLLATAVGPAALRSVGARLAQALARRLAARRPVNIVTFENHRRAPELLVDGLLTARPELAREVGSSIGVAGAAVWRAISVRSLTRTGVVYKADAVDECHIDGHALVAGIPPHRPLVAGLGLADRFDDRMVEKLWVFNAGHAAAAYLGHAAGHRTIRSVLLDPELRESVAQVVDEARFGFEERQRRRGTPRLPVRTTGEILARYADPMLADPVARVARDPRRKLAVDDRLIGPAIACLAAGRRPQALAAAAAAALAYDDPTDAQASTLQRELSYLGADEVLATVSGLHPCDELSKLIVNAWHERRAAGPRQPTPEPAR